MSVKTLTTGIVASMAIVLALFAFSVVAEASATDNVEGYAWSSNIGWVSLNNCADLATNPTCIGPDYGVSYDYGTGEFSGFGWNNNIGWIDFDQGGPDFAKAVMGGTLNSAGWDGLIDLSGVSLSSNNSGTYFSGYGWNGENLPLTSTPAADIGIGWLDFSTAMYVVPVPVPPPNTCNANPNDLYIDADSPVPSPFDTTIQWASVNQLDFISCDASGDWSGSKDEPANGNVESESGVPVGSNGSTYRIECEEVGGDKFCAETTASRIVPGQPAIALSGPQCITDPALVTPTIFWSSSSNPTPTNCVADWSGNSVGLSGSETVVMTGSQTFRITCDNGVSDSHLITVNPTCSPIIDPDFREI